MPSHTLTTTDRQEAVLKWLVDQVNLAQTPPLTVDEFLQQQLVIIIHPHELRFVEAQADDIRGQFAKADVATQTAIKDLLASRNPK